MFRPCNRAIVRLFNRDHREKLVRSRHLQNWKRCSSPGINRHGHPIFQLMEPQAKIIAPQRKIDNFSASNGWVSRFKDRHGLVFKKLVGQSVEVRVESTDAWLESLPSLLRGYKPGDVYNADETGLFFNVLPDRTLAYKGEFFHGGKHSKNRLTVLCVNSDGSDKQVPIVIGISLKPSASRTLKNCRLNTMWTVKHGWRQRFFVLSSIL